jgi:hypothetical protein
MRLKNIAYYLLNIDSYKMTQWEERIANNMTKAMALLILHYLYGYISQSVWTVFDKLQCLNLDRDQKFNLTNEIMKHIKKLVKIAITDFKEIIF